MRLLPLLWLAGLALGSSGTSAASTYAVQVGDRKITVRQGAQRLRSYPVPVGYVPHALVVGQKLAVVFSRSSREVRFRLHDLPSGRLNAAQLLPGTFGKLFARGDTLFLWDTTSGAVINDHRLISPTSLPRQAMTFDGLTRAENARSVLLEAVSATSSPYGGGRLDGSRHDTRTHRLTWLPSREGTREGSGEPWRLGETFTASTVTATRQDNCAQDVVRFDWTRDSLEPVSVTPRK